MSTERKYVRSNHCVYLCDYHVVFPTKYRHKVINGRLWKYLYGKLLEITQYYPQIYFKQANHDEDHVHLLISIPPQMKVGDVVRIIKTNTSRGIKEKFPELKKRYWGTDSLWSEGYFVSTVGVDIATIHKYIANQGDLDSGQTATLFD